MEVRVCKRCKTAVIPTDTPGYACACPEHDEDLYSFETELVDMKDAKFFSEKDMREYLRDHCEMKPKSKSGICLMVEIILKRKEQSTVLTHQIFQHLACLALDFGQKSKLHHIGLFGLEHAESSEKAKPGSCKICFQGYLAREPNLKDVLMFVYWLHQFVPMKGVKASFRWERGHLGKIGEYEWENSKLKFYGHNDWNSLSLTERKKRLEMLTSKGLSKWDRERDIADPAFQASKLKEKK